MRMAIQGIGICGGFGQGVAALRAALQTGRVEPQEVCIEHKGMTDRLPVYQAAVDGLTEFIPKRALRRIDHFSKMTLLGACLALKDADLLEADRSRTGVVIATGYGTLKTTFDFLDSYLDFGYSCSSPTHFSNSVHNAAAAHVSMQFKATAPSLTLTQFEMSVSSALLTAQIWLAENRVDQVLFGAVDESCEVLHFWRKKFFAEGEQGPIRPFALETQSAVVGEGVSFLLLTRAEQDAAYAFIDRVKLGNHDVCSLRLPQDVRLIVGADGHKETGPWYAQVLKDRTATAYAPLYGSFPAAAGFDLAVAALMLRERKLYLLEDQGVPETTDLQATEEKLACLKFGPAGDYGLIQLSN